jgi:SAM-dependent methyltransferase
MRQAEIFDQVAELYDAARPSYPQALFQTLAREAGLAPGDRVLEVGCGTGKATQGLIDLGLVVTALDPGENLLRQARRRFGDAQDLVFVQAPFETWDAPAAAFRLVASAQAWHWIPSEASFPKAAAALAPGGVLAVFANCPSDLSQDAADALASVFARHGLPRPGPPPETGYRPDGPMTGQFAASGLFEPARHALFHWTWRKTVAQHMAFLRSRSDIQLIPAATREPLLADLGPALRAAMGDELALPYESHLYWARKAGPTGGRGR